MTQSKDQLRHEKSILNAFVIPEKRKRFRYFIDNPNRRRKFLDELYHFCYFDDRFVNLIPPTQQYPEGIAKILRAFGSPDICLVISTDDSLDGREMNLEEVLDEIVGYGQGSILSCVPGKLAFFEGEGPKDRYVLRRK